jgi:hypothetical protein
MEIFCNSAGNICRVSIQKMAQFFRLAVVLLLNLLPEPGHKFAQPPATAHAMPKYQYFHHEYEVDSKFLQIAHDIYPQNLGQCST